MFGNVDFSGLALYVLGSLVAVALFVVMFVWLSDRDMTEEEREEERFKLEMKRLRDGEKSTRKRRK